LSIEKFKGLTVDQNS